MGNRAQRVFRISPDDTGAILDIGPASDAGSVATYMVQVVPTLDFIGQIAVVGRVAGQTAIPFASIPYRRVVRHSVASDYALATSTVADAAILQIPANGLDIGLEVACTAGSCRIATGDLLGPSMVSGSMSVENIMDIISVENGPGGVVEDLTPSAADSTFAFDNYTITTA